MDVAWNIVIMLRRKFTTLELNDTVIFNISFFMLQMVISDVALDNF